MDELNGDDFEREWLEGRRDFSGSAVSVSAEFIATWQVRVDELRERADEVIEQLAAWDPQTPIGRGAAEDRLDKLNRGLADLFRMRDAIQELQGKVPS